MASDQVNTVYHHIPHAKSRINTCILQKAELALFSCLYVAKCLLRELAIQSPGSLHVHEATLSSTPQLNHGSTPGLTRPKIFLNVGSCAVFNLSPELDVLIVASVALTTHISSS